jgi:hypothetical protein
VQQLGFQLSISGGFSCHPTRELPCAFNLQDCVRPPIPDAGRRPVIGGLADAQNRDHLTETEHRQSNWNHREGAGLGCEHK